MLVQVREDGALNSNGEGVDGKRRCRGYIFWKESYVNLNLVVSFPCKLYRKVNSGRIASGGGWKKIRDGFEKPHTHTFSLEMCVLNATTNKEA